MEQIKEIWNKTVDKVKSLNRNQKIIFIIVIIIVLGIVTGLCINSNNKQTNIRQDYTATNSNKLKLTDEMIKEIKKKVSEIDSPTETAVLKISLGETFNSIEITKQDLTDAYTYTVYIKAIGVNKADYINYKIKYTAIEDKTTSKGYSIDRSYDLH